MHIHVAFGLPNTSPKNCFFNLHTNTNKQSALRAHMSEFRDYIILDKNSL